MTMAEHDKAVLLVEDDPDIREDLAFLLEHQGYAVVTAEHGLDALRKLQGQPPPCLILLDLMMPVMDGWTLCAELRKDPRLSQVPVVLLSGAADLQHHGDTLAATACLTKPVELTRIYDLVDTHCTCGAAPGRITS